MNERIWDGLTEVFRDQLDDESLVLQRSMTANDVDGWDSITHVLIVVAVEKKFRIKLSSGDIQGLKNVGEFADLIERKLA